MNRNLLTASTEAIDSLIAFENWIAAELPESNTKTSTHLFIALSNAVRLQQTVTVAMLENCGVLPQGRCSDRLLSAYADAGLITQTRNGPKSSQAILVPTEKFLKMMLAFEHWHTGKWVQRRRFRQKLVLSGLDEAQQHLVVSLFDEFFDCDYLHIYGSCCVLMSCLLAAAARLKGHRAQVVPSCLHIADAKANADFVVGREGIKGNRRQVDAHAVCLIDEDCLVDFGMGAALRDFNPNLPWAVVSRLDPQGHPVMAEVNVAQHLRFQWLSEGFGQVVHQEIARMNDVAPILLQRHTERFGPKVPRGIQGLSGGSEAP